MSGVFTDYLQSADPGCRALVDSSCSFSYGDLNRKAGLVAAKVRDTFGTGNYLVIKTYSSVDFVVALIGVMYSGNVPIPVAADLPIKLLDRIRNIANATAIIDPPKFDIESITAPTYGTDPALPCMILFTSGTTGHPKGVVISHKNIIHSCEAIAEYLEYRQNRSAAVVLPLHYSYALLSQVMCQLYVNGFSVLLNGLRNPFKFSDIVNAENIATFCGVPSTFVALKKAYAMRAFEMPTVRVVCTAGASMNTAVLPTIKTIFPNATLFNNYGMTEAAPRIAFISDRDPKFLFPQVCGRPINGLVAKIVNPTTHCELAEGTEGMLVVKGPNITSAYLNDPERTEAAFTDDGFLITGDIGKIDKGVIFLSGRNDDIFNVGGEKVSPIEIEHELDQIPEIEMSAVRGIADDDRGAVPVAFVILKGRISKSTILATLEKVLRPIAIPHQVFQVSSLPLTPNGKIKRNELDPCAYFVCEELL